ncbi:hypothetical protein SISSUDRAFT_1037172 [Sistotremastrum suecicum HHB10207 ss-3]|uniref:Uncharacterized protein n=1 Tax=Sistotremastrum suecicum HHB10207 ss-3 TaxID=1314776 RepID=A0A165YHC4_9AGAM|nr:hypothetical protein SISSUDRAFT_1037172 [Sistotremastrum suecicum HHB10207 ss-3]
MCRSAAIGLHLSPSVPICADLLSGTLLLFYRPEFWWLLQSKTASIHSSSKTPDVAAWSAGPLAKASHYLGRQKRAFELFDRLMSGENTRITAEGLIEDVVYFTTGPLFVNARAFHQELDSTYNAGYHHLPRRLRSTLAFAVCAAVAFSFLDYDTPTIGFACDEIIVHDDVAMDIYIADNIYKALVLLCSGNNPSYLPSSTNREVFRFHFGCPLLTPESIKRNESNSDSPRKSSPHALKGRRHKNLTA